MYSGQGPLPQLAGCPSRTKPVSGNSTKLPLAVSVSAYWPVRAGNDEVAITRFGQMYFGTQPRDFCTSKIGFSGRPIHSIKKKALADTRLGVTF